MSSIFQRFAEANIAVAGDVMLDRYWQGSTSRISPEAPVPVVTVGDESERIGGSGNVAANIASLGANAYLWGVVGSDAAGHRINDLCEDLGIHSKLTALGEATTTVKLRIISQHQQLIRLDFESRTGELPLAGVFEQYEADLTEASAVVLSDYGKGYLSDPQPFIQSARQKDINVIVDPKGLDFDRYRGAFLITPNLSEFEAVVGSCANDDELDAKGQSLIDSLELGALLVTRGERGMALIRPSLPLYTLATNAKEVFDVTGAGDTVCAVMALAIGIGESLENAVQYANAAAGVVVSKLGTATVTPDELAKALELSEALIGTPPDQQELIAAIHAAKKRGERIVMTNGCFDIIHAGHVNYLRQAAALGDHLIVAVNSDASVGRLKGPDRPINTLEHRVAVLNGLSSVDSVLAFDEDTPLALIQRILPDVLVKGGDYEIDTIVGADVVQANGGKVKTLPFVEGLSTTNILRRLEANNPNESEINP